MFDFDVVTGPTNPARPAKPEMPAAATPLTSPPSSAATKAMREDSRAAEHSPEPPGALS
jgi:hypothetical protein